MLNKNIFIADNIIKKFKHSFRGVFPRQIYRVFRKSPWRTLSQEKCHGELNRTCWISMRIVLNPITIIALLTSSARRCLWISIFWGRCDANSGCHFLNMCLMLHIAIAKLPHIFHPTNPHRKVPSNLPVSCSTQNVDMMFVLFHNRTLNQDIGLSTSDKADVSWCPGMI